MGKYLINGSKYEIDDSIQGEELTRTLEELAAATAPEPVGQDETPDRDTKIAAYLAETDAMLGLPAGTSYRQIKQESQFKDDAVSPVGARGIAQVMPATQRALERRWGRNLDPHNTDDALAMHRELMRENMKRFKNAPDALRAYNAGWDRRSWDNKETNHYVKTIYRESTTEAPVLRQVPERPASVAPEATTDAVEATGPVPFPKARNNVDPAKLFEDKDWLRASRQLYALRERRAFTGSDEELAEWGKDYMGYFNSNMVDMARYAHDLTTNGTDEDKQAFLYLMDTYDNTEFSWEGAGRAAKGILTDPTNLVGLGTLGVAAGGKILASAAAKQGIKKAMLTSLGRTGVVAGIEGAIFAGAENTIRQGVEVSAGRKDSISGLELAGQTALGATVGTALGTLGDAALTGIMGVVRRAMPTKAPGGPVVPPAGTAPSLPPSATPAAPVAPPVAPAAVAPDPADFIGPKLPEMAGPPRPGVGDRTVLPETVLTEGEIGEATARQQKGRLWVDDLPPVTPANDAAAAKLELPDTNTGLRSTPRSMAELTEDGEKIASQLRELDDKTMHGVLESLRNGSATLEDSRVIARGVQIHADELRIEQAELIKKIGLSTNAQETVKLTRRLAEVEDRLVPLSLADDAFGSMAGSMLRQRQEGLAGIRGVSVESIMAEQGLTKEAAEATYARLVAEAQQTAAAKKVTDAYDGQIQEALKAGDVAKAAQLTLQKQQELAAHAEMDLPGAATFWQKANEFVISNVFSPTTLAINLVPAAVKTLVTPAARALVSDPLSIATRRTLVASYTAMASNTGAAWRAAKASFRYEQSLLTRGTGRLMEGELAMTGKAAGYIRFFPRMLSATDEFLGQLNYAAFVAGEAAAKAGEEAAAKGATGKLLSDSIKVAAKIAVEQAYEQPSGEALLQPLINKGVNLGLTGGELTAWVRKEAARDPRSLRHGSNEVALDVVRDMLYKRNFSGKGTASSAAQGYEQFMNKVPSVKLIVGQLFFRTPIRVFEEGIRLTPGLQILAPGFVSDLAGKNGALRQARASAEAMTSLALVSAVMTLYASGSITGDGAYDNWKAQRTATDGPAPAPYTIKFADGSTWSYRNFDPVATPFKIIINGMERLDKLAIRQAQGEFIDQSAWDQALAYVTVGTSAIAAALRDANLVAGLDQTVKLFENLGDPEGKEDAWVKMFGEKLALLVPNTMHKIAKTNDPTLKDPADFWQVVETRLAAIHVDREDIKTTYSYDVLGNVRQISDTGVLWNIFSTATPEERAKGMTPEAQAVMLELDRLQRETGVVFSPPVKHRMTGDFDLRTTLTGDGQETLYDRWQRNYRSLQPDQVLAPLVNARLPDGTFKHKAAKVETIQKAMNDLRDAAFMMTLAQEERVVDEVIKKQVDAANAQAGFLDFNVRTK